MSLASLVRRNENLLDQKRSLPRAKTKKIEPLSLCDGPFSLG